MSLEKVGPVRIPRLSDCAALAVAMLLWVSPSNEALAQGHALADATAQQKPASAATIAYFQKLAQTLPFHDREDYALAERGFMGTIPEIRDASGRPFVDLSENFFNQPAPTTVNPSLWRDAQLLAKTGLFKVSDRIYQVRGFNISNMSIILGAKGFIIVDPGSADELTSAGLALAREKLGNRAVTGVIYTHSHIDHYGGAGGVITPADVKAKQVPVVAPDGFLREVVSENVIAGPAMGRRLTYMAGLPLKLDATGTVGLGIGPALRRLGRTGTVSIIPPTHEVKRTGEEMVIDGVRLQFQLTPNTEAPAEMNIFLPDLRALCLAENANGSMHNILTPRGAQVRDAKAWADYLTQSISLYGDKIDTLFTSHFWPHWGHDKIISFLSNQRDAYKFLHDQSVRMMNNGLNGTEIAEVIRLPNVLDEQWYNHGYYGNMSFNAKSVYQRYMGWYDGNPANLNPLPPEEAGRRYVEAMGGADQVLSKAKAFFDQGDYRWTTELLSRLVFADPDNRSARLLLADSLEQQGYQAESAVWRNMFLTGALELRNGGAGPVGMDPAGKSYQALPLDYLFDMLAVRLVPERALANPMAFRLVLDSGEAQDIEVRDGVLIHQAVLAGKEPLGRVITTTRAQFIAAISGQDVGQGKSEPTTQLHSFATLFDRPVGAFGLVLPKP